MYGKVKGAVPFGTRNSEYSLKFKNLSHKKSILSCKIFFTSKLQHIYLFVNKHKHNQYLEWTNHFLLTQVCKLLMTAWYELMIFLLDIGYCTYCIE